MAKTAMGLLTFSVKGATVQKPATCHTNPQSVRDALIVQYQYLPLFVYKKSIRRYPAVRKMGLMEGVSIGNYTLLRAATRWNEAKGAKFITYAFWSIWRELWRAAQVDGVIKVPLSAFGFKSPRQDGLSLCDRASRALATKPLLTGSKMGTTLEEKCLVQQEESQFDTESELTMAKRKVQEMMAFLANLCFFSSDGKRRLSSDPLHPCNVISAVYGLDGSRPVTLSEYATKIGVSKQRVYQAKEMAMKAFRASQMSGAQAIPSPSTPLTSGTSSCSTPSTIISFCRIPIPSSPTLGTSS